MNKIAIIGCGNMGLIYANSFLRYKIVTKENLLLVEKNEQRQATLTTLNIGKVVTSNADEIKHCNIIILAVKPQDFKELAETLKRVINPTSMILSIMAGTEMALIQSLLNHQQIVRAMPNLPVEISMGMTAYCASPQVNVNDMMLIENLLSTTGRTLYLKDEQQLNAVTALSGSGPAYFFYFMKYMIEAGVNMGIEEHVSSILAKQTMLGAFQLINNGQKSLDDYITSVASKGGTTEAALTCFNENKLGQTIIKALSKAEQRAKELSLK